MEADAVAWVARVLKEVLGILRSNTSCALTGMEDERGKKGQEVEM